MISARAATGFRRSTLDGIAIDEGKVGSIRLESDDMRKVQAEELQPEGDLRARRVPIGVALPADRHPAIATLLDRYPVFLRELVDSLGSPLHAVLPCIFEENVAAFRRIFADRAVDGTILFAKKANKADCFVRTAARIGIGVDVASAAELAGSLAAGIPGDRIGVSGPEKDDTVLTLALQHRCLVAIDSMSELDRFADLAGRLGTVGRVLLRGRMDGQRQSRFGLAPAERAVALERCRALARSIELEGFAFHLGGYATVGRAAAADGLIDECVEAQASGLAACRTVNIGGGLPVRYVDAACWTEFLRQDAPDHYHARKAFAGFYPYGVERAGADALDDILSTGNASGQVLSERLRRCGIRLIVEPGRALLDQAGLTLFRVQGVKALDDNEGYAIVTVEGSSLSLSEQWFNSEFLPEPVLLIPGNASAMPFAACIAGSTCLENDVLTWRKIAFPRALRVGDLIAYVNTAGYQMDSNESSFHEAPLPLKVVLDGVDAGERPFWRLDTTRPVQAEGRR